MLHSHRRAYTILWLELWNDSEILVFIVRFHGYSWEVFVARGWMLALVYIINKLTSLIRISLHVQDQKQPKKWDICRDVGICVYVELQWGILWHGYGYLNWNRNYHNGEVWFTYRLNACLYIHSYKIRVCKENLLFLPSAAQRTAINRHMLKTGEVFVKYMLLRDIYAVLKANKALSKRRSLRASSSPRLRVVCIYIT
jgi:hypothetical protein